MSLTTSLLFRTLATLEGTPEHPVPWLPARAGRRGLRQRAGGAAAGAGHLGADGQAGAGDPIAAAKRARTIPDCEIEILPRPGHIMSVDEPEFVGARIANFLQAEKG
jgi:hypothetical protein